MTPKLLSLLLLPGLASASCEANQLLVDTGYVQVVASGIHQSGGGWSIAGVHIQALQPEKLLVHNAEVTLYRDRDGEAGFTQPPDQFVDQFTATSPVPTDHLSIGSFSNQSHSNGVADSWQINIEDEHQQTHAFSGNF